MKESNKSNTNKGKKQCTECGQFKYYNQFEPKTSTCKNCLESQRDGLVKPPHTAEDVFIGNRLRINLMDKKSMDTDYKLINMMDIDPEAREIAVRWGDEYFPGIAMMEKHKLASDIMNYARRKNNSEDLSLKSDRITLLEKYSNFLMKEGYMDTDWYSEEPGAIEQFLKTLNEKSK